MKIPGMGEPHVYIGPREDPYLLRWYVIPRNKLFNIYLHKIVRDDDDRALHDHPWWNVSIILQGEYLEIMPLIQTRWKHIPPPRALLTRGRKKWDIVLRRPTDAHRLVLSKMAGKAQPCWSLFLTGPVIREWGFWCPKGWRHHDEFVEVVGNQSIVGKGCD